MNIENLLEEYHKFAEKQFPNSTAISSLEGLKREIVEVEQALDCLTKIDIGIEYVDCLMYILDSARRAGISTKLLFIFFEAKLEINKERIWKINDDKSYSHVK